MNRTRKGGNIPVRIGVGTAIVITLTIAAYFFSNILFEKWPTFSPRATFSPSTSQHTTQQGGYMVYFANPSLATGNTCGAVYPVPRDLSSTARESELVLDLFGGPTTEEKRKGYTSVFSSQTAFAVESVSLQNGVVAINLSDIRSLIPNAASTCAGAELLNAIHQTLAQFKEVTTVVIGIQGDARKFYDWVGLSCGPLNNNCDNSVFGR